jgi:hypothetical protein
LSEFSICMQCAKIRMSFSAKKLWMWIVIILYVGRTVNNCMLCQYIVIVNHCKYHIIHFYLVPIEDCRLGSQKLVQINIFNQWTFETFNMNPGFASNIFKFSESLLFWIFQKFPLSWQKQLLWTYKGFDKYIIMHS